MTVAAGQTVELGRDVADSHVSHLFDPYVHVSRLHASVRMDAGGQLWLQDADSTNGTTLEERRVPPREWVRLEAGGRFALAGDVTIVVAVKEGV
ncbi:FHA domain-containing protein [Streptomyces sp. NPDC127038]|uniref:FHA domain-containing protein n=1 Tax=Streptomyces sp. NPDC127038 TaxID=3347114 RepID=UPI003654378A